MGSHGEPLTEKTQMCVLKLPGGCDALQAPTVCQAPCWALGWAPGAEQRIPSLPPYRVEF